MEVYLIVVLGSILKYCSYLETREKVTLQKFEMKQHVVVKSKVGIQSGPQNFSYSVLKNLQPFSRRLPEKRPEPPYEAPPRPLPLPKSTPPPP